jgi:hypothetical protein
VIGTNTDLRVVVSYIVYAVSLLSKTVVISHTFRAAGTKLPWLVHSAVLAASKERVRIKNSLPCFCARALPWRQLEKWSKPHAGSD